MTDFQILATGLAVSLVMNLVAFLSLREHNSRLELLLDLIVVMNCHPKADEEITKNVYTVWQNYCKKHMKELYENSRTCR